MFPAINADTDQTVKIKLDENLPEVHRALMAVLLVIA